MSSQYPDAVPEIAHPQVAIGDDEIFEAHVGGKLSVALKAPLDTQRALSIAYTPGVAQVSRAIASDRTLAARYTPSTGWWRSSATAARCWASVTSVLRRRCP